MLIWLAGLCFVIRLHIIQKPKGILLILWTLGKNDLIATPAKIR